MILLPYLLMAQPAGNNTAIDPIGNRKSTEPNSASLRLRLAFTVGILDAQVAKVLPQMKKNPPTATRYRKGLADNISD